MEEANELNIAARHKTNENEGKILILDCAKINKYTIKKQQICTCINFRRKMLSLLNLRDWFTIMRMRAICRFRINLSGQH